MRPELTGKLNDIVASLTRDISLLEAVNMCETASLMRIVRLDLQIKLGVVSESDLETMSWIGTHPALS